MGDKRLLHAHQRIAFCIVADVGRDAEHALVCRFHAVGHLYQRGIILGGGIGQRERLFYHIAEAVVFVGYAMVINIKLDYLFTNYIMV